MYIDNKFHQPLNSGEFSSSYAYRFINSKMPIPSNNHDIFVNSNVISSRLFTQNHPQNLHNRNSGNMILGSNEERQVNQRSFCSQPLSVNHLGQPMRNLLIQRDLDANDQQSFDNVAPLNSIASNIGSNTHFPLRLLEDDSQPRQRLPGRYMESTDMQNTHSTTGAPCSQLVYSPPRNNLGDPQTMMGSKKNSVRFDKCSTTLRKRNRSDTSTESYESHSSKPLKPSELNSYSGTRRKDTSRSSRSRYSKPTKPSSPKYFNKRDSYNMKRLDLGPSIGISGQQKALKSRLADMVFSDKALAEDKALLIPSLPSILSLP